MSLSTRPNRTPFFLVITVSLMTLLVNTLVLQEWKYKSTMAASYVAKNSTNDENDNANATEHVVSVPTTIPTTFRWDRYVAKNNTSIDNGNGTEHGSFSPTFRWDYLDLNQEVNCGSDKCLFRSSRSISNIVGKHPICGGTSNQYYQTGYLVAKDGKYEESILDGWKISQYMVQRFGIKHFFLEPPIRVQLDKEKFLRLFFSEDGRARYNSTTERIQVFWEKLQALENDPVSTTVQKIKIAPKTFREIRRYQSEDKIFTSLEELLDGFKQERGMPNLYNSFSRKVIVAARDCGFLDRLRQEIAKTVELLRCEPLMALDFQFILDTSGNLYHLDFDRVLTNQGGLWRYNQTVFDAKVRGRLADAMKTLQVIQKWIRTKQEKYREGHGTNNTTSSTSRESNITTTTIPELPSQQVCKGDWEAEETTILASKNLPCLATERAAMARNTITSSMFVEKNGTMIFDRNSTFLKDPRRGDERMRHPLLVALLKRVIDAGFYSDAKYWDCNAYGDRVPAE